MSDLQFIRVGRVEDFRIPSFKRFTIVARHVAVFREPSGEFFATEISCKHQNADLTTGEFHGFVVTCPRHGWKYNVKTGECLNQHSAPLRRHGLKIEDGDIYITLFPIAAESDSMEFEV